jgi:hypothetical protein
VYCYVFCQACQTTLRLKCSCGCCPRDCKYPLRLRPEYKVPSHNVVIESEEGSRPTYERPRYLACILFPLCVLYTRASLRIMTTIMSAFWNSPCLRWRKCEPTVCTLQCWCYTVNHFPRFFQYVPYYCRLTVERNFTCPSYKNISAGGSVSGRATHPRQGKVRSQMKCSPWSSRLGVGREGNYCVPKNLS